MNPSQHDPLTMSMELRAYMDVLSNYAAGRQVDWTDYQLRELATAWDALARLRESLAPGMGPLAPPSLLEGR